MNLSNYDTELKRKIFHSMSAVFPLLYLFVPKLTMVVILMITTGIALSLDISRHYNTVIQDIINKFFAEIMRQEEKNGNFKLSGVSYMFLGLFISCVLFSKGLAIASFLILIISDSLAALIGKRFGIPLKNGKSFEGSAAFCISAILIGIFTYTLVPYKSGFLVIIIASIATSLVEYHTNKIKINDNLTIPLCYGIVVSVLSFLI